MTPVVEGYCLSALPDMPMSTICLRIFPTEDIVVVTTQLSLFGTTVSAEVLDFTNTLPFSETISTTVPSGLMEVAISVMPMVTLVHKADETTTASRSGGSVTVTTMTSNPGGGTETANAVVLGLVGTGRERGAQRAMLACICAATMGAMFILSMAM